MRRRRAITLAATATAPGAEGAIRLQHGIAGVRLGVGSTRAELLAAHPTATCPDALHCVVGREEPGRTVSSFALRQAMIGYVID